MNLLVVDNQENLNTLLIYFYKNNSGFIDD